MNKRERKELYEEAALIIFEHHEFFLCWAFGIILKKDEEAFIPSDIWVPKLQKMLPEFKLFQDTKDFMEKDYMYWKHYERDERVLGALFMAEMCK